MMEANQDLLMAQIDALREELVASRELQARQQESITSLIALSQQQTAVLEQQNAILSRLVGVGENGVVPTSSRLLGGPAL